MMQLDAVTRGCFITMEGLDGAGKSTHVQALVDHLHAQGLDVVSTREPGGTPLGEKLRELLLTEPMHLETETLLMFAARCEHLQQLILPALRAGSWVVCDRFTDATYAYQGGGRQLGGARVATLEHWVHPQLQPDRTWIFDVPLEVARERLAQSRTLDRFEREQADFFQRTRQAYHERVAGDPQRLRVLDGTQSIQAVRSELLAQADELLSQWRQRQQGHRP